MIPVIYRKADYLDTLKYVLSKKDAQIIDNNMGGNSINDFNKQFIANRLIKPDLSSPCVHLILSIANKEDNQEHLSNKQWSSVARKYLQELGYLPRNDDSTAPAQYVAARHHDREHEHLHIITSQIRLDGSRVSSSFDYFKAQTATRLIAHEMGLEVTPTSCEAVSKKLDSEYGITAPTSDNRSKSIRQVKRKGNEASAKDIMFEAINGTIEKSKNTAEFIATLEEKQIYPIARLDKEQQILGFAYTHKGITIAASQISRKLSWNKFKDTIKFGISNDDLQLLLDAKSKGLADISRHKEGVADEPEYTQHNKNSTSGSGDGEKHYQEQEVVTNTTNAYISVVPSIEEVFQTEGKTKRKTSQPINNSQDSKASSSGASDDKESSLNNNDNNENTNTYISVLPSIKEIFKQIDTYKDKESTSPTSTHSSQPPDNITSDSRDNTGIAEVNSYTSVLPSVREIFAPSNKQNNTPQQGTNAVSFDADHQSTSETNTENIKDNQVVHSNNSQYKSVDSTLR